MCMSTYKIKEQYWPQSSQVFGKQVQRQLLGEQSPAVLGHLDRIVKLKIPGSCPWWVSGLWADVFLNVQATWGCVGSPVSSWSSLDFPAHRWAPALCLTYLAPHQKSVQGVGRHRNSGSGVFQAASHGWKGALQDLRCRACNVGEHQRARGCWEAEKVPGRNVWHALGSLLPEGPGRKLSRIKESFCDRNC